MNKTLADYIELIFNKLKAEIHFDTIKVYQQTFKDLRKNGTSDKVIIDNFLRLGDKL